MLRPKKNLYTIMTAFAVVVFVVLTGCLGQGNQKPVATIKRDTTITTKNAFTSLTLDSAQVAKFINSEVKNDSLGKKIINFYYGRNFQFAWFNEEGFSEQGAAFWNLYENQSDLAGDTSFTGIQLHQQMQKLLGDAENFITSAEISFMELRLTSHFLRYLQSLLNTSLNPEDMQWFIPSRKIDETAMLDSFIDHGNKSWTPLNSNYYRMELYLEKYAQIATRGGWQAINLVVKELKPGQQNPAITAIKKRLTTIGVYNDSDTSDLYTVELSIVAKQQQEDFGFDTTGKITDGLVQQWNVPVEERIKQIKINLERMRWMPETPDNWLLANIPEFKLHVFEQNKEVLNMNIVVGTNINRTVIFSNMLSSIVFSPYWHVPFSIIRKEIMPSMRRSSDYLAQNNMEITGYANQIPIVRQKPGKNNSLGKVKFLFPNQYNIYFHDTPAKALFNRRQRAFSHGCIRLGQPADLANYLLRNDTTWSMPRIKEAMNAATEKEVALKKPVPVFIVYFTSWVDESGHLNFRKDIYDHDKKMEAHLFN